MTVNHSVIFLAYHSLISLKWHSYLGSFLPSVTKLRQGNVFTPVCQSFHSQEAGCLADTSLVDPGQTPPVYNPQVDTPRQTPPVAWTDTPTRWADTPWADSPRTDTPAPGRWLSAADGTHPTGMHSCCQVLFFKLVCSKLKIKQTCDTPEEYDDIHSR